MKNLTLDNIMALARVYASSRDAMEEVLDDIRDRRRQAVRSRMRALRNRVAECASAKEALRAAVEAAPELFAKPRTQTADGVKFGWRKQSGAIEIADEKKVVERIRKKLPDRVASLVKVKETVDKTALRKLKAADLAKLGLSIADPVDEVTITVPSTDIDKLVNALLEEDGGADMEDAA